MTKATQERETPVSVRSGVGAEPVIDEPRIRETRILIVGGGLSGICTAAKLQACGESDVRLIERAGTFGGTWRDNTYPGCACDIPSPTYSFAFAPNPRWSKLFAPREEIQQYLLDLAENFRTSEVTDFDTELERAEWDAETRRWIVRTNRDTYIAQILIMATGLFKNAVIPPLDGVDTFEGAVFHSSKWDHDVDLRGKRVAVVGTGASALQFIPKIQPEVAALTVCQRTPIWVMPKLDPRLTHNQVAVSTDAIHSACSALSDDLGLRGTPGQRT